MRRHFAIAAALGLTASLGIVFVGVSALRHTDATVSGIELPAQLDNRVELHPGEKLRTVDYVPHTNRPIDAQIHYKSGDSGSIKYRPDGVPGTPNDMTRFYAGSDTDPAQSIKSQKEYAEDGVTPKRNRVYWPAGTLQEKGDLLTPDKFESYFYQPDGETILRHTVLSKKDDKYPTYPWRIDNKELYRADHSLAEKIARQPDDGLISEYYYEWSAVKERITLDKYQGSRVAEFFAQDGKTLTKKIDQTYEIQVQDLNSGKLTDLLKFGFHCGSVEHTMYDANGVPTFRQTAVLKVETSKETEACHVNASMYRVTQVQWFDDEGKVRKEESYGETGLIQSAGERDAGVHTTQSYGFAPGTRSFYDTEGKLTRFVRLDADGKISEAHDYKDNELVMGPKPDPALLVVANFETPPETLPNAHVPYYGGY